MSTDAAKVAAENFCPGAMTRNDVTSVAGAATVALVDPVTDAAAFLHGDLLARTTARTDASGTVVDTWDCTPCRSGPEGNGAVSVCKLRTRVQIQHVPRGSGPHRKAACGCSQLRSAQSMSTMVTRGARSVHLGGDNMVTVGPLSGVQLAHIAREHYINGKSRVEIADETGLSRFKVGRMLEEAVATGIIKFEIVSTPGVDLELSVGLQQRFALEHAIAVDLAVDTDAEAQAGLGAAAADFVGEFVGPNDVLGLTSGRTLNVMARRLETLPCRVVVQLAGIAGPLQESGLEVIRRLAQLPRVQPWPIYASLVMGDAETAKGTLRQPGTRSAVEMYDHVTVALCAVGSWVPQNSLMMINPAVSEGDRDRLIARGVVGEVAATLVTDTGGVIHDLDDRCIAITEAQLRAIASRIAIAGGPSKTRAIRAVLGAGLLTGLVTDSFTARRLIEA